MQGNYFNGNFGKVANDIILKYRYREVDSTNWSAYTTLALTKNGGNFSYSNNKLRTDCNTEKAYIFEFILEDKLNTYTLSLANIKKSTAVFDYGEEDFRVNYDFSVLRDAKKGEGTIFGEETLYKNEEGTAYDITLTKEVSNFKRIKIFGYATRSNENDYVYFSKEVSFPYLGACVSLDAVVYNGSTYTYLANEIIQIISNNVKRGKQYLVGMGPNPTRAEGQYIYITEITGVK